MITKRFKFAREAINATFLRTSFKKFYKINLDKVSIKLI
jgi:hypothetical protein